MKKKYYGVVGINGYGVYDDYEKTVKSMSYLVKEKCKSFSTFEDAKNWAEDSFYEMQKDLFDLSIEPILRVNWIYYKEK